MKYDTLKFFFSGWYIPPGHKIEIPLGGDGYNIHEKKTKNKNTTAFLILLLPIDCVYYRTFSLYICIPKNEMVFDWLCAVYLIDKREFLRIQSVNGGRTRDGSSSRGGCQWKSEEMITSVMIWSCLSDGQLIVIGKHGRGVESVKLVSIAVKGVEHLLIVRPPLGRDPNHEEI